MNGHNWFYKGFFVFSFSCFRPFSVTPSSGTLDVFESTQVTVVFNPMTVGDHSQDLLLHYHTGERKPPKLGLSPGDVQKIRKKRVCFTIRHRESMVDALCASELSGLYAYALLQP